MNTAVLGEPIVREPDVQPHEPAAEELVSAEYATLPPEELALGTCIHGKYIIHGVLGHGGFAVVYDAEHVGLARRVAIKVLHLRADTPLALLERFHCEARISALVRHPNVLEVYDTGTLPDGSPFLVMERVEGETLSTAIARGALPLAMVVELGVQLARGLQAIADAGIVHRDIKPDNVMLHMPSEGPPRVKLVDFGISKRIDIESAARLTCVGALVGTPQYMSPEQIRGEDVDVRSDIYALGAVLYEGLTGRAPHESTSFSELVVAVLNSEIIPPRELRPNCPAVLEQVLMKALSRPRDLRFSTPLDLLEALERAAEQLGLPRDEEAFYAPDPQELTARPPHVLARDTVTLVRRLWPLRAPLKRPLHVAAAALAIVSAQGAYYRFGGESEPAQSAARPATATAALHEVAREPKPTLDATRAVAVPLFDDGTAALSRSEGASPTGATTGTSDGASAAASGPTATASLPAQTPGRAPTSTAGVERRFAEAPAGNKVEPGGGATTNAKGGTTQRASEPVQAVTVDAQIAKRADWDRTMQAALAELVRGQLAAAQSRYREAVRLLPREASGFRGLGLVSARLGDSRTAREALQRYLELAPAAPDAAAIRTRLTSLR